MFIDKIKALRDWLRDTHERLIHIEAKIDGAISIKKDSDVKINKRIDDLGENIERFKVNQLEMISAIEKYNYSLDSKMKDVKERLIHIEDKENRYFNINRVKDIDAPMDKDDKREIRVHYIRSVDWHNAGDMSCNPYDYFQELKQYHSFVHHWKNIDWKLINKRDVVVLGGGGLFDCTNELQEVISAVLNKCENVISWGCGYNTHHGRVIKEKIDITKFRICTCRDYVKGSEYEYCPDVSCMMEALDEEYKIIRDIGVIEHLAFSITEFEYEKISNRNSLNEVIKFIGESKRIITNSWHCAYWAQLMGKKVVIYKPFSDKFDNYRYRIGFYSGDIERDFEHAEIVNNMLAESRKINVAMKNRVVEFIHSVYVQ